MGGSAAWRPRPPTDRRGAPGTDGHLALALARVILDQGWADFGFAEQHTERFGEYRQPVVSRTAAELAAECDVPLADVERLAEWHATTKPASIWVGSGIQLEAGRAAGRRASPGRHSARHRAGHRGRAVRSGKGVNVLTDDVMTDAGLSTTYYNTRVALVPV